MSYIFKSKNTNSNSVQTEHYMKKITLIFLYYVVFLQIIMVIYGLQLQIMETLTTILLISLIMQTLRSKKCVEIQKNNMLGMKHTPKVFLTLLCSLRLKFVTGKQQVLNSYYCFSCTKSLHYIDLKKSELIARKL